MEITTQKITGNLLRNSVLLENRRAKYNHSLRKIHRNNSEWRKKTLIRRMMADAQLMKELPFPYKQ